MFEKLKKSIFIFFIIIFSFNLVNALNVYVGLEILTLEDDPTYSCINSANGDYGPQGKIRAISSILPDHPLYFNLSKQSDGTTVWAGDGTKDTDYGPGEIIFLPNPIDLTSGETYNLMMDIDAIRIYLPLNTYSSSYGTWSETTNDEYWTAGQVGAGGNCEFMARGRSSCAYSTTYQCYYGQSSLMFVGNYRGKLTNSCATDGTNYNCDQIGLIGMYRSSDWNFKIANSYNNLYQPTVGNFNMQFVMP